MKKFFFAIFSVTFFFLMFISGKKIKENKQLNLNEKYRVIKYQGFTFDEQVEHLIIGPEYNIIFYEEKSISKATLDYYGDVESLEKINGFWVGKLAQYHKISGKDYLGRELFYLGEVGKENHKKFLENYREYFIIGENIEKFNLTYQEVIYYIKSTINFKDPNKFIQRYGNESDFTYEYLKKQYNFVSKGYNFNDEQLLKIFKKRKYISILIIVLILLIELIFYKTIKNHKKNKAK